MRRAERLEAAAKARRPAACSGFESADHVSSRLRYSRGPLYRFVDWKKAGLPANLLSRGSVKRSPDRQPAPRIARRMLGAQKTATTTLNLDAERRSAAALMRGFSLRDDCEVERFSSEMGMEVRIRQLWGQESGEQIVSFGGERIYNRDSPPCETMVQILGEQQAASTLGGSRKNHGVPDAELMVHREVRRCKQGLGGSVDQGEGARQPRIARRALAGGRRALRTSRLNSSPRVCTGSKTELAGRRSMRSRATRFIAAPLTPSA